jgi:hypothetical protein
MTIDELLKEVERQGVYLDEDEAERLKESGDLSEAVAVILVSVMKNFDKRVEYVTAKAMRDALNMM